MTWWTFYANLAFLAESFYHPVAHQQSQSENEMHLMTNLILINHLGISSLKWSQNFTEWMCEAKIV